MAQVSQRAVNTQAPKSLKFYQKIPNYLFGLLLIWVGLASKVASLRFDILPEGLFEIGEIAIVIGVLVLLLSGFKFLILIVGILVLAVGVLLVGPSIGLLNIDVYPEFLPFVLVILGVVLILAVHKVGRAKVELQSSPDVN